MATNPDYIIANSDRQLKGGDAPVTKLHKVDYEALTAISTTTSSANAITVNAINNTNTVASLGSFYKSFFVGGVGLPTRNMVVDGTTPVEFTLEKAIPVSFRLVCWELTLYLQSGGNLEPLGFGADVDALINGIELKHDAVTIENWRSISHLAMDFNREEADFLVNNKRNLNGVFYFQNAGNVRGYDVGYDANFRIIIQDNMTTIAKNLDAIYMQLKGNLEAL